MSQASLRSLAPKSVEPLRQLEEPVPQPPGAAEGAFRLLQQGHGPGGVLVAAEVEGGAPDGGEKLFTVAKEVPPLQQGLLLPRPQVRPFNLLDLVLQSVHPPRPLRLVHSEAPNLPPDLLQGAVAGLVGLQLRKNPAEAVQIAAMALLIQEKLAVVLAVNVEKAAADLPQLGHGDGSSVGPAGVFPVAVDLPLEDQLPVFRDDAVLLQNGQGRHTGKESTDEGLGGPGADQIPAGPLAQHRAHGVDDDGLAGPGLTGEGVEAPGEGNVRLLDHRDILNMQQLQHLRRLLPAGFPKGPVTSACP